MMINVKRDKNENKLPSEIPSLESNVKHSRFLEQKWLKNFSQYDSIERNLFLRENGIDYEKFYGVLEKLYCKTQNDISDEDLDKALKRVRAITKRPRIGKKGKMFLLRHAEVSRKLREKGASYKEISIFLKNERKFIIAPDYLKKMMETL